MKLVSDCQFTLQTPFVMSLPQIFIDDTLMSLTVH